jgi:hypothetical protein
MTTSPTIYDVYGSEHIYEPVRVIIENEKDPGAVLVIGPDSFREDFIQDLFKDSYEPQGFTWEQYKKDLPRLIHFKAENGKPFSFASEKDAVIVADNIKRLANVNTADVPVRMVLILWPWEADELKYLAKFTAKIPVYILWPNDLQQDGTFHAGGVFPRTGTSIELPSTPVEKIKAVCIEWVAGAEGYLPKGMVGTLIAPKGQGKTKVCDWFTNRVVKNGSRVLRMNLEDPRDSVLRPGIFAAGVTEEGMVEIMDAGLSIDLSDPAYIAALKNKILKEKFDLVIIEPMNNYKGKAKVISEDDMRPIYTALSEQICVPTGVMILVINHTNRKKDAADASEKSHGASSNINVARVNFMVKKDKDNPEHRLFMDIGSNIPVGKNMVFIIEGKDFTIDGVELKNIGYAVFKEFTEKTADEVVEQEQTEVKGETNRIAAFITEFLTGKGEVSVDTVKLAASNENHDWKWDNIRLVFSRKKLGTSRTAGSGKSKKTFWTLHEECPMFDDAPKY